MPPPWPAKKVREVILLAETNTVRQISQRLNIPFRTIRNYLWRSGLRACSDLLTLTECARKTGYTRHHFKRAKEALGQKWRSGGHMARGKSWGITEDQLDEMCEYLKNEK